MFLRFSRRGKVVMAGAMGAAAAWQVKRRRKQPAPAPAPGPDPAQELRARLDESRTVAPDPAPPADVSAAAETADPADRRRSVHEEARSRLDDLKNGPESTPGATEGS